MNKNIILNFIILITCSLGFSQSLSKQIINSSGLKQDNSSNQLSWSLGEPIVGSMTSQDGSVQLSNGYYTSLNLEALNIEDSKFKIKFKVYPNPVSEYIHTYHPQISNYNVRITDISGQVILDKITSNDTPINISSLTTGTYLLVIHDKQNKKYNTYKFIKK